MENKLVSVGKYVDISGALLAQGLLRDNGKIESSISETDNGIELMVAEENLGKAKKLLEAYESENVI